MTLADDFKNALSTWTSGVSVVTTRAGDQAYGITASSFTSVSLDPPLVLVCIGHESSLLDLVRTSRRFAVSVLSADQASTSDNFARPEREPSAELDESTHVSAAGMPIIDGAMAYVCCELHQEVVAGDHVVLLGHVTEASVDRSRDPLVYFQRGYREITTQPRADQQ